MRCPAEADKTKKPRVVHTRGPSRFIGLRPVDAGRSRKAANNVSTSEYRPEGGAKSSQSKADTILFARKLHGFAADKRLDVNDKATIDALLYYALLDKPSYSKCTMSDEALADYVNVSVATIKRSLFKLAKFGYIRREARTLGKNSTNRIIHLVWVRNESIVPPPPPMTKEARAAALYVRLHVPPEDGSDQGEGRSVLSEADHSGSLSGERHPRSVVSEHPRSVVSDKRDPEFQTGTDSTQSKPPRPSKGRDGGRMGGAQASGSKAKHPQLSEVQIAEGLANHKPAKVDRTLKLIEMTTVDKFTDRTLREAKEFIIEAGPENHDVIAWACRKALVDDRANVRDGGKAFRSRFQVMRKNARKAIEEGGIPSGNPPEKWYGEQDPPGSWEDAQLTPAKKWDLMNLFPECAGADATQPWPDGYTVKAAGQVYDEEGQLYHHCRWDGSTKDTQQQHDAPTPSPRDRPAPPADSKAWIPVGHLTPAQKAQFKGLANRAQSSCRRTDLDVCAEWLKHHLGGAHIAAALVSSWVHGPTGVDSSLKPTVRALTAAGVCMHRVKGYSLSKEAPPAKPDDEDPF